MPLPTTKPYLVRAIHEWCCDNGFTPYIAVKVGPRTHVPIEFVKDGQIVLNISAAATNRLVIGNDLIEFQARFGGVARELSVPLASVLAIYARENGGGMAFEADDEAEESVGTDTVVLPDASDPEPEPPPTRPRLQRVK
ncbi:MAG: ClpXP protease specificity-enhancing factor [Rhodocyclaceae bacterium]|nr:ClpXP protease specificity-enhancing factor [Rhodocyclaceae bacterium]